MEKQEQVVDEILDPMDDFTEEEKALLGDGFDPDNLDRGDSLDEGQALADGEASAAGDAGEVEDQDDDTDDLTAEQLQAVADINEDGQGEDAAVGGMPLARAGEIAREKNAAFDLASALADGAIDKRWIDDMGGQKAVVKAIAAGKLSLPETGSDPAQQPASARQVSKQPDVAGIEKELADLEREFAMAAADADTEAMVELQPKINAANRKLLKAEMAIDNAAREANQRAAAVKADFNKATVAATEIEARHPELQSDTVEFFAFIGRRDLLVRQGYSQHQAILQAEKDIFPATKEQPGKSQTKAEEVAAQRSAVAAKNRVAVATGQPPRKVGVGSRSTGNLSAIDALSDDEFDRLPAAEKARARGDLLA